MSNKMHSSIQEYLYSHIQTDILYGVLKHICFILWYATQFCVFAIQDFDSRLSIYLNRPVIVFNVNMYMWRCYSFSHDDNIHGHSCSRIQGDISVDAIHVASLKNYFVIKSKVIFSKVISFHQSCILLFMSLYTLYNSSDVWMILFCLLQTINNFKMCNYNNFRSIWILCKLYNVL